MDLGEIAPIIAIASFVIAVLNFAHTQFQIRMQLTKEIGELSGQTNHHANRINITDKRLENMERVINELRESLPKIELFWDLVREHVPKMLLHPDDNKRDTLLMKLSNNTIKHDEALDLKAMLESDLEHYKQNREIMQADPMSTLLPFALWALEVKLKQTNPSLDVNVTLSQDD